MAKVGKPRTYPRWALNANIFLSKVPAEEHKPLCSYSYLPTCLMY
jgi:hypothetical protein